MNVPQKRLTRTTDDAMVAGVCSGLARYLGMDPTLVRVLYVLVSLFSAAFPGLIVYIVLWLVLPVEGQNQP